MIRTVLWCIVMIITSIFTAFAESTWRRHQMETFFALLAICAGDSPVPDEFPTQRPVTRSFEVFFDLRLNKRLSKKSWGWWFETLNATRPHWWQVKIGSGNGLVSSGNTPLSQPMFPRSVSPYDVTRPQWVTVNLILILVNEFMALWCIYIHLQRHIYSEITFGNFKVTPC